LAFSGRLLISRSKSYLTLVVVNIFNFASLLIS
jgi:hypothetical protein